MIETLRFEIAFDSEADARAGHFGLGDFAANRVATVIGEVFDEFSGDEDVLRLDTLELDIGRFRLGEFASEAEARLREAVRRALRACSKASGPATAITVSQSSRTEADFELLWRLLHRGTLPWSAARTRDLAFDDLVARVLEAHGDRLVRSLRGSPVLPQLLSRIARQWSQDQLRRLALLLSPSGADAVTGRLAAVPEIRDDSSTALASAWTDLLLMLSVGSGADPSTRMREAHRAAFEAGLADARLAPTVWKALLIDEPDYLRARLARYGQGPAWRRRFALSLTPGQWRELMGLWAAPTDVDGVLAAMSGIEDWAIRSDLAPQAALASLREGLLARLFADRWDRLGLADGIASLVRSLADLEGRHPVETASALVGALPDGDRAPALRQRLRLLLDALGQSSAPLPGALEADLARNEISSEAWKALLQLERRTLAGRLVYHGQSTAWRRGFAKALTPERWRFVLGLWAEPADAQLVLIVFQQTAAWGAEPAFSRAELTAGLGEALLTHLLVESRDRLDVAAVVQRLVITRAEFEDLTPARAASQVVEHSPADDQPRLRAALRALLDGDAGVTARRAPHSSERQRWRDDVDAQLVEARLSDEPWGSLLAWEPAWLAERLRRHGGTAAWRGAFAQGLTQVRLSEVLALWARPPDARLVAALTGRVEPWRLGRQTARTMAVLLKSWLLDYLLIAPFQRFEADAALRYLVLRRAQYDDLDPAQVSGSLAFAWAPNDDSSAVHVELSSRLRQTAKGFIDFIDAPLPRVLHRSRLQQALHIGALPPSTQTLLREALSHDRTWLVTALRRGGFSASRLQLARVSKAEARARRAATPALRAATHAFWAETTGGRPFGISPRPAYRAGRSVSTISEWTAHSQDWLSAADIRRLSSRLVPAEAGLRQLESLSEDKRRTLFRLLRPAAAAALDSLDLLSRALSDSGTPGPQEPLAQFNWRFLLREFFEEEREFDAAGFVARWFASLTGDAPNGEASETRARLAGALEPADRQSDAGAPGQGRADNLQFSGLSADIVRALRAGRGGAEPEVAARPIDPPTPDPLSDETLYVANAGMVLAGPYLPTLFERVGLTREGAFIDDRAVERAVHLLQFLVDGGDPAFEHALVLNKLLCGLDIAIPIGRDFVVSQAERETIEGLLRTMIQRWSILGATSIAGLRETFFQREGALTLRPEMWRLLVEPRSFDMLLDKVPWGFATLKLPWMAQVLHVDWR
ncbi:MAG TPA: contractile injection system tape measure protein [Caulobacteraceae bacterium]|nr:contractile injection system tape measure protein [Caulobacteraceae bacterium]